MNIFYRPANLFLQQSLAGEIQGPKKVERSINDNDYTLAHRMRIIITLSGIVAQFAG